MLSWCLWNVQVICFLVLRLLQSWGVRDLYGQKTHVAWVAGRRETDRFTRIGLTYCTIQPLFLWISVACSRILWYISVNEKVQNFVRVPSKYFQNSVQTQAPWRKSTCCRISCGPESLSTCLWQVSVSMSAALGSWFCWLNLMWFDTLSVLKCAFLHDFERSVHLACIIMNNTSCFNRDAKSGFGNPWMAHERSGIYGEEGPQ